MPEIERDYCDDKRHFKAPRWLTKALAVRLGLSMTVTTLSGTGVWKASEYFGQEIYPKLGDLTDKKTNKTATAVPIILSTPVINPAYVYTKEHDLNNQLSLDETVPLSGLVSETYIVREGDPNPCQVKDFNKFLASNDLFNPFYQSRGYNRVIPLGVAPYRDLPKVFTDSGFEDLQFSTDNPTMAYRKNGSAVIGAPVYQLATARVNMVEGSTNERGMVFSKDELFLAIVAEGDGGVQKGEAVRCQCANPVVPPPEVSIPTPTPTPTPEVPFPTPTPVPPQPPRSVPTATPFIITPTPVGPEGSLATCKGTMSLSFLRSQLEMANYGGPWDEASMVAAFNKVACPFFTPTPVLPQPRGTIPTATPYIIAPTPVNAGHEIYPTPTVVPDPPLKTTATPSIINPAGQENFPTPTHVPDPPLKETATAVVVVPPKENPLSTPTSVKLAPTVKPAPTKATIPTATPIGRR